MNKRITVKNVKTFAGHDGLGWQCSVYLDGKKLSGQCVDDGWGGGLVFNGNTKPVDYDALNEACMQENPEIVESVNVQPFEFVIPALVNKFLQEKHIMRQTKKEVWFTLEGEDPSTVRTFKRRVKVSDPQSHMEEHAIIDAIVKVGLREKKAVTSILGIRHATKRKELAA